MKAQSRPGRTPAPEQLSRGDPETGTHLERFHVRRGLRALARSAHSAGYVDLALAQAVPLGVSFVLTLVSAALLGPELRGVLTFLMTAALLGGALAYGSLHVPVVDELRGGNSQHLRHGVILVGAIWGVLTATGAVLVITAWPARGLDAFSTPFDVGWALIGSAVVVAQLFLLRVLQGLGDSRRYQRLVITQSVLYLVGSGGVLLATGSPLLMYAAWYVSVVASLVLAVAYLRARLRWLAPPTAQVGSWRRFLRAAMANNVGSIGQMVMLRADVLVVALLLGPASAGVYGIALSLTELSLIAAEIFALAVYANRARMEQGRWSRHVQRAFRTYAVVAALTAGAIALGALVLAQGPLASYEGLVPLVLIILPGTLFAGYTRIALSALQALSRTARVWRFGVLALLLSVGYVPAVAWAGMTGAAVMASLAYAASAVFLRRDVRVLVPGGAA